MLSLPHARGGVSEEEMKAYDTAKSSPHTWGCFLVKSDAGSFEFVFPTHVGVFPKSPLWCGTGAGFPHTRGGVSTSAKVSCIGR